MGTKADLVNADPSKREVAFDRCVDYAAEHLGDGKAASWIGMDACHEISARDDQGWPPPSLSVPAVWLMGLLPRWIGVDEVFQVIARKLVEKRTEIERERIYGPGHGGDFGTRDGIDSSGDRSSEKKKKAGACC